VSAQRRRPRGAREEPDERDDQDEGEETPKRRAPRGRDEISRWEWVAGAVGLLIVGGAVAFLAREAMLPSTPPDVVVRVDSVTRASGGHVVHFTARNQGRATASAVTVEGELVTPPADTARGEVLVGYVPGRSERAGGLYFARDPRTGRLTVRAQGYAAP